MDATEIMVREVQSASGFQVRQAFRESVRQARKTSHLHSNGQVLSLYKAGAHVRRIGRATNRLELAGSPHNRGKIACDVRGLLGPMGARSRRLISARHDPTWRRFLPASRW